VKGEEGKTALDQAKERNNDDVVKLLKKHIVKAIKERIVIFERDVGLKMLSPLLRRAFSCCDIDSDEESVISERMWGKHLFVVE